MAARLSPVPSAGPSAGRADPSAASAVTSKHLIRHGQRHFPNPAAVGLLAVGVLLSTEQRWWGGLGDLPPIAIAAVASVACLAANADVYYLLAANVYEGRAPRGWPAGADVTVQRCAAPSHHPPSRDC